MERYINKNKITGGYAPDLSTRRQRRAAVTNIIRLLERVRDNEESYRDNIPENMKGSEKYESAEQSITLMEEVLDLLGSAY